MGGKSKSNAGLSLQSKDRKPGECRANILKRNGWQKNILKAFVSDGSKMREFGSCDGGGGALALISLEVPC